MAQDTFKIYQDLIPQNLAVSETFGVPNYSLAPFNRTFSPGSLWYNSTSENLVYSTGTTLFELARAPTAPGLIIVGPSTPYTTIKAGIAAAAALLPTPSVVQVRPGTYIEDNPLVVPGGVSVVSVGGLFATTVQALNTAANLFEIENGTLLQGFRLSATLAYAIAYDGSSAGSQGSIVESCVILGCGNGILAENTPGTLAVIEVVVTAAVIPTVTGILAQNGAVVRAVTCGWNMLSSTLTNGVVATGAGTRAVVRTSGFENVTNGATTENDGTLELDSCIFRSCTNVLVVQGTGTPVLYAFNTIASATVTSDLTVSATAALISLQGGILRRDLFVNPNDVPVYAIFFSGTPNSSGVQIFGELSVGAPSTPAETAFGGGTTYTSNLAVLTDDGSGTNFVNISTAVADPATTVALFQGTAVGNVLYVGGLVPFYGLETATATAWGSGDSALVTVEYFAGVWTALAYMVTQAVPPYACRTTELFATADTEQVRFGPMPGWVSTAVDGITKFWCRVTVTGGAISAVPINSQIQLSPSYTHINTDGFREFFGDARVVGTLNWDLGLLEPANASPGNQDLYVGSSLGLGRVENLFANASTDRIGFNVFLPAPTDTSYGVKLLWAWQSSATGGSIAWVLRWGYTNDTGGAVSAVFPTPGSAPATGPNQQTLSLPTPGPAAVNSQVNTSATLDVSQFNPFPVTRDPDMLWVTLERTVGDTHTGDVALIQIQGQFVRWNDGAHISSF